MTPRPSSKRERLWLNQVSTKSGEGQGYHHRQDEKRAYLEANRSRYCEAEYAGTSKILDEFCVVSGYPLTYAIRLRAHHPRSPVGDLCRQLGVSETPFYTWKKKDASLGK
jgi:hypothetical protein